MSRTIINVSAIIDASRQINSAKTYVSSAKSSFTQTKNSIDGKIKNRYNINERLCTVQRQLSNIDSKIGRIRLTVQSGANQYCETDDRVESWKKDLKNNVGARAYGNITSSWASYFKNDDDISELQQKNGTRESHKRDKLEELITKTKPYVIGNVLNIVSPVTGLLYITSGVVHGKMPSVINETRSPYVNTAADWLGYELSDDGPGITAWLGKASASSQKEWGYAGVNAYLGKAKADVDADFSFMKSSKKKEYVDGKWVEKTVTEFVKAEVGGSAAVSAASIDGKAGLGSDMLGVEVKAEGSAGNAKVEAKGKFSITEDGVNANLKGEAMVSAVEGEAKGTINILGIEITGKIGGYAGAVGVEGKVGIEDNKFVMEGGAAALLGVSGGVEIGFNNEGWDNFVDFVTFWD